MERPGWWEWPLEFTFHVEARMEERGLSEVELRTMLEDAITLSQASAPERWIVSTRRIRDPWEVVVEPDPDDQHLLIVTAYPRESQP